MKKVAIVILNWNGRKLMEEFLPSVVSNSPEWAEVIVADNGSTDDSIEMLKAKFPTVGIISFNQNYGFAEGYNQALKRLDHEYCVLLNSDVEVTPNWLDAPIATLDSDPSIACVQPKIRAQRNKEYFEYAGAAGGYIDKYGYPFCRGRILHIVEKDEGQYDTPADILWATGACLFVRTATYKEVGGLDAGFFAHQEEVDMCWRLRSRGYRLVCVPQSIVYHVGGATLNAENPRQDFLEFPKQLIDALQESREEDLKHVMCVLLLARLYRRRKVPAGRAFQQTQKRFYEARKAYHQLKPEYTPKRKENLEKRTLSTIPELMRDSLILAFYLKGKRTFKAIKDRR